MIKAITFLLTLSLVQSCLSLDAISSSAKLPSPRWATAAVYDGDDSIYIIGGYRGGYNTDSDEIVRYNITSETVQVVGRIPNDTRRYGCAVYDEANSTIYYYGGMDKAGNSGRDYFKIELATGEITKSNFAVWSWYGNAASVWDSTTETAYLFGSPDPWDASQVIAWSKSTAQFNKLLPRQDPDKLKFDFAVAVYDSNTTTAYVLGGSSIVNGNLAYNRIFKYSVQTNTLELVDVPLPFDTLWTSGVWDSNGGCAYVVGDGFYGSGAANTSLVQYCPGTDTIMSHAVTNFPSMLQVSSSVFVPKLNRIYTFGGFYGDVHSDDILYIDL